MLRHLLRHHQLHPRQPIGKELRHLFRVTNDAYGNTSAKGFAIEFAKGFAIDFSFISNVFTNILARGFGSNFDIIGYAFVNTSARGLAISFDIIDVAFTNLE